MESAILIRGVERWLIIIAAMLCLWLSTQIKRGPEASTGRLKWDGYLVELKNVGPNVFFAGFGALILIVALFSKLDDKVVAVREPAATPVPSQPALVERRAIYLASAQLKQKASDLSREIARVKNFSDPVTKNTLTSAERAALDDSMNKLAANQSTLFELVFGEGSRARFDDYASKCLGDPAASKQLCQDYESEFGARLTEMKGFGK